MRDTETHPRRVRRPLADEKGGVLIAVLIMTAMGVLVLGSLTTSMLEAEIAGRTIEASQAFYHADTGLEHALAVIVEGPDGLSDDLVGADGVEGTADDGFVLGSAPVAFGEGSYRVRLVNNWDAACTGDEDSDSIDDNSGACDEGSDDEDGDSDDDGYPDAVDGDGIAHLWVVGRAGDSVAAIRATIDVSAGAGAGPGIYTNGVLFSGNNSQVDATDAGMHGNAGLDVAKNSSVHGEPTTSGRARLQKGTVLNGDSLTAEEAKEYEELHSGLDPIEIPEIDPLDYRPLADYRLAADGMVYDSSGSPVADGTAGKWNSWFYDNGQWNLEAISDSYATMTVYVEGDAALSSDGDITTTVIATGSVSITGKIRIRAHKQDTLVVAGGDIDVGGRANTTAFVGNFYAHEQIQTRGTSGIRGSVVAQDAADDHDLVTGAGIQLGSEVIADTGVRNTLMQESAGISEWYVDQRGRYREYFQ